MGKRFRFQATWLTHDKFQDFIVDKWDRQSPLVNALSKLSSDLQAWNKEVFGNIFIQKRSLIARITGIQKILAENTDRGLIKLESKLRRELDEVLAREETLWYQKPRVDWLQRGDKNTTFFHLSATLRQWRNRIAEIKSDDGTWLIT